MNTPTKLKIKARRCVITLDAGIVTLANEFGMIPECLAERVIAAFVAQKPSRLVVKARRLSAVPRR